MCCGCLVCNGDMGHIFYIFSCQFDTVSCSVKQSFSSKLMLNSSVKNHTKLMANYTEIALISNENNTDAELAMHKCICAKSDDK